MSWFFHGGPAAVQAADVELAPSPPAETSRIECVGAPLTPRPCNEVRLRQLVDQHLNFVWRYLRRMGHCGADCDEILQDAFLVAARRLDGIREGSERAYLLQVALNIASTRRRSFSRELLRIDRSSTTYVQEVPPDPEQAIEDRQARQELDSVLSAMPHDLRNVFVLYELEEQSTRQISELLSLKEGTVASRLRRARLEFRRLVEQRNQPPIPISSVTSRRGAP